jgi:hypothetical protein
VIGWLFATWPTLILVVMIGQNRRAAFQQAKSDHAVAPIAQRTNA